VRLCVTGLTIREQKRVGRVWVIELPLLPRRVHGMLLVHVGRAARRDPQAAVLLHDGIEPIWSSEAGFNIIRSWKDANRFLPPSRGVP
jgi:hypothetical protein